MKLADPFLEGSTTAAIPAAIWDDIARKPGAAYAVLRGAEGEGTLGVARAVLLYQWGLAPEEPGEAVDQLVLDLVDVITPRQAPATHQRVA